MRHSEIEDDPLTKEDRVIFGTLILILVGMVMTILGIFTPHESSFYWEFMLPIGLPLWIVTTVSITKNLTYDFMHDIVKALDVNK
jgi:hypothetical protein